MSNVNPLGVRLIRIMKRDSRLVDKTNGTLERSVMSRMSTSAVQYAFNFVYCVPPLCEQMRQAAWA